MPTLTIEVSDELYEQLYADSRAVVSLSIEECATVMIENGYKWQPKAQHDGATGGDFPVEVQPPQHVIEGILMDMEGDYCLDTLRYVVYNDTDKDEWLKPAAAPVPTPLVPVPDGPLGTLGAELRNRAIFVPCTMHKGIMHGYTLADGELLVRQQRQGSEGE